MNLKTEKYYQKKGYQYVIGIDEVGRGPWAGPVTVTAVLFSVSKVKKNKLFKVLLKNTRDSKKLSASQREKLVAIVKRLPFIKFATSSVSSFVIDKINIEKATQKAIKNCLQQLKKKYSFSFSKGVVLIDGNKKIKTTKNIFQRTIINGDDKVFSIALASVIAKVVRDKKMKQFALLYPQYHLEKHKGYGTKLHLKSLKKYGPCKIHRKSYRPIKN